MPKNLKIEKIEETEAKITSANATFARLKREFLADDGIIDAQERETLDRVEGKISVLERTVSTLRAEVEANRKIWEGRAGDYDALRTQQSDLNTFGYPGAETLADEIAGIPGAVADQRWADATAILDQGETSMGLVWGDYLLQKDARATYEPLRFDLDTRFAGAELAEPQTEAISGPLTQIGTGVEAIEAHVEAVNYVEALALVNVSIEQLAETEAEIIRVQQALADYLEGLAALTPKLAACAASGFPSLIPGQQDILTARTAMEDAAALDDYDTALHEQCSLSALVDAFLPVLTALQAHRAEYDQKWPPLAPRLAAASSPDLGIDAALRQEVLDAKGAVETAVASDNYEAAVADLATLASAITTAEAAADAQKLFELREVETRDKVTDATSPDPRWEYLRPITTVMVSTKSSMDTSAGGGDFDEALVSVGKLEGSLVEFDAEIEAKKFAYEAERERLDVQLKRIAAHVILPPDKAPLNAAVALVDAAAKKADWALATSLLVGVEKGIAEYFNDVETYDKAYKDDIKKLLPGVQKTLEAHKGQTSDRKKRVIGFMAEYELALKKSDLSKFAEAQTKIFQAASVAKEMDKIEEVSTRLGMYITTLRDDEARKIVADLDDEELWALPIEAQNMLVTELMGNDEVSEEDHDAIQKIWSTPSIDPEFEAFDKKAREGIAKAFQEDPKMHYYATHWDNMDITEKERALFDVADIPTGEDGWNVGGFDHLQSDPANFDSEETAGHFSKARNEMAVRLDGDEAFIDVVMTVTHEAGHKYQSQLVARLKGKLEPTLKPGDPEYEQAKALELNSRYIREHTQKWKDMVEGNDDAPDYATTPGETHSRNAENEIELLLGGALGEYEENPDDEHMHEHEHEHE